MHPFCAARPLSPPCLLSLFPLPQSSLCFIFSPPHPSLPKPLWVRAGPYSPPLFSLPHMPTPLALSAAAQGPSSNPHPLRRFSYRELQQAAG
ncbi:unnamed protein product, partial [Closterium sp. Naga37s-1]